MVRRPDVSSRVIQRWLNEHGSKGKGDIAAIGKMAAELGAPHVPAAIMALAKIANDKSAPAAARISAANSILDRACGKPAQAVQIGGDKDSPLQVTHHVDAFIETLRALRQRVEATDVEPEESDGA